MTTANKRKRGTFCADRPTWGSRPAALCKKRYDRATPTKSNTPDIFHAHTEWHGAGSYFHPVGSLTDHRRCSGFEMCGCVRALLQRSHTPSRVANQANAQRGTRDASVVERTLSSQLARQLRHTVAEATR
ncbi:hypothetical protein EYF80_010776 [Liparis tanakae]|uniref:Uncharacterized protein n=1 Tax=Liparis tanakae TaxID=230148 RepID=A0A4Z2IMU7_9TELE|nr:hypothetical protein EYF80_010776 [Liparis tanakae]